MSQQPHTLKELKTRKAKLEAERNRLKLEMNEATKLYTECRNKLEAIAAQIKQATAKPTVTEHATLRYLERKCGVDVEAVKAEILTEKVAEYIRQFGSGKFPIGDGMRAVVKENVIVTVEGRQ